MFEFLVGILEQGLIFGILSLGVYITYKILDFPDLSVEGTFPLGAAVSASLIVIGVNPFLASIGAFFAGCVAGIATGILNVKFKITSLLSGILVMTALYSINLTVMKKPNIVIQKTIFSSGISKVLIVGIFIVVSKILIDYFLSTKLGYALKAAGDNPQLVTSLGVDIGIIKIIGVSIANGFAALGGAVLSQSQSFADIGMGSGVIVIALGSIILGTSLFKKVSFLRSTSQVIIGAILYRGAVALALRFGLPTTYMKITSAILVVIILILSSNKITLFKSKKVNMSEEKLKKVGEVTNA